jgi:dTDP-4-dehydrorhamnose 3,5-epimerase
MKFHPTPLKGVYLIEMEKHGDDRGFFARAYCEREFADAGLVANFVQANNVLSARRGTLRGLHYQLPPAAEVKVVRALRGALYDVVVDLRPGSSTYLKSFGAELNDQNKLCMYVPRGFAHGMITLVDNVETFYLVSDFYAPERERGLRYDDPVLDIEWPVSPVEISQKDSTWPVFDPHFHGVEHMRISN